MFSIQWLNFQGKLSKLIITTKLLAEFLLFTEIEISVKVNNISRNHIIITKGVHQIIFYLEINIAWIQQSCQQFKFQVNHFNI